ncbi:CBASS cGAMP-activated phospholipase [Chitinophaga sp. sic0106]|uniref:CBASS cGAMP-activated phospholipase n=1 Tax=Chitinophaga sp. sic0106 TaxID=2854785 RepID=UPI001C449ADE|nr:CBASS cGAMP-activated phospholipase [Chitinophaga sp. sic0106]MBV7529271.1 patatin-like phospholipase family protein [Chitinophaga sp. sic0106]
MDTKPFRILSIDGGGIRGIFPAKLLAETEAELATRNCPKTQIWQYFDLISGTSTGGILSLALSLGIPAIDIYNLYREHAKGIFGNKRWLFPTQLFKSAHNREYLENLLRSEFSKQFAGRDPILKDCKTATCIPIYDLFQGKPSVLKSKYHPAFVRDFHIPAYQAALATSAAPTFFNPYSSDYIDTKDNKQLFHNKVDGGVFANNPTLLAIIEAQKAFNQPLSNIEVLSIGTGHQRFVDGCSRSRWGLLYWAISKKRIIDLFMQGQSQQVQNLISLMKNGIDRSEPDNFRYMRIDTELDDTCKIELDDTNPVKLDKLAEKAQIEFQNHGNRILSFLEISKP